MAELTLLVNSTDAALLAGNATLPAAANGVVADASAAGGFAGVLGKQLKPNEATRSAGSTPPQDAARSVEVAESGESSPLDGKALPLAVPQELEQREETGSPLLDASLLSAITITQGVAAETAQASALTPAVDPALARMNTALSSAVPPLATIQSQSGAEKAVPTQLVNNAAIVSTLLNPAVPLQAAVTAGQSTTPVLPNIAEDTQRAAVSPIIPTLLGKPITAAQQQALERASLSSGKANLLRTGMTSSNGTTVTNAQQNTNLSSALTGVNNPLGNTLRMDLFTAAMGAATQANNELRLQTAPVAVSSSTSATATNLLPDGAIILPADATRLPSVVNNTPSPTLTVSTPAGQPAWASELGQRVTWLANNELREAKLQLNPRSLGAVDVRISYGPDQQLNVSFSTANPIARDALDASLPRLREMFEQQGLQLADANISHESPREQGHRNDMRDGSTGQAISSLTDDELSNVVDLAQTSPVWMSEGMLDAYA